MSAAATDGRCNQRTEVEKGDLLVMGSSELGQFNRVFITFHQPNPAPQPGSCIGQPSLKLTWLIIPALDHLSYGSEMTCVYVTTQR